MVSAGDFWSSQQELSRYLKYMAHARISEFESDMPSQSVRSLRASRLLPRQRAAFTLSPPVTEVAFSGLTKLLISWENELLLRGSPRGGPSEGRAGDQRDQCESSHKCLLEAWYHPSIA